jgi:flavin-dependent dehydrogenase
MAAVDHCDALVIGGGPAGATAARLLASWGWSVVLVHRDAPRRPRLAESLPASIQKLLALLGQLDAIRSAGFHLNDGNVARWGGVARDTRTPDAGFHVPRAAFDRLLRREAAAAGVRIIEASVRRVDLGASHRIQYGLTNGRLAALTASIVLDCSGRAGIVARRGFRRSVAGYRTLAIAADWDCPAWPAEERTRTLVESDDHGWAWSVPVSETRRQCTVMVDPAAVRANRSTPWPAIYHRELARAPEISARLAGAQQRSAAWACDASVYEAPTPADRGVLLVGDAASFIEPLSSAGVKKAMTSAWRAAVVANTWLTKPTLAAAAQDFYVRRERDVFAGCQRIADRFFAEAAACHAGAFWSARTAASAPAEADPSAGVRRAFERLRASPRFALRLSSALRFGSIADIEGREVVMREAVVMPGDDRPVRFAAGVNLPALARLAARCDEVPALFAAYTAHVGPVPMDGLLTGLSLLVARQALIPEVTRS